VQPPAKKRRAVRVEDVAREAGVSPITVSRTLSAPHKVRPETRQLVTEAVQRTGYVVNSIASTLKSGRSSIITVLVPNLQNPHLANTLQGLVDAFEGSRFRLMFIQTGWDDDLSPEIVESIGPFRPAGIVLVGVECGRETSRRLMDFEVPVVEIGERSHAVDVLVQTSSFEAGRMMGEHFGENRFKTVAFCGHTLGHGAERLRGFRAGLERHGLEPAVILPIEGNQSFEDGVSSIHEILRREPKCDAVFYGSDVLAFGAMMEAQNVGIDVPGRLAIAGYGDLDFSRHLRPSLTTINISAYDSGERAGEMMLSRLAHRALDRPVANLPVHLQARLSTKT
jgi:LacI family gluconate utilization system Gnt-I transcriptional repressor